MKPKWDDPKQLADWLGRLKGDRTSWEGQWQEIADNQFGRRDFVTTSTPGRDRTPSIYDTTAMFANTQLAGTLHGMLANPMSVWFELRLANRQLFTDHEVRIWLEDCRNRMLTALASGRSRWTTNLAEIFWDVGGFGTAGLWVDADPRSAVRFSARPLRELYLEEGHDGDIDVIFREFPMTARQFATRFPNPMESFPEIERSLEKNQQEKFTIAQMIAPSDDPMAGTSPFRKPWTSVVFMVGTGRPRTIDIQGYDEKPILTPRWSVDSGETYGRGCGHACKADAQMLNVMQKTILKAGLKATDPPLLVSDQGVLRGIRTEPGGINYVQDRPGIGGQPDAIRPLQNNGRVEIGIELIDRKMQGVRNAYWAHLMQLFDDPRMTATQVLALTSKVQMQMSPITGRQQHELFDPLLARVFGLMMRGGWFAPPPSSVKGQDIEIVYVSPLAASQRAQEAQAIMQSFELAAMIAQTSQSTDGLDHLDPEIATRIAVDALAMPQRAIRDIRDVAQRQQARSQLAAEQLTMQQLGAGSEIAKNIGQAVGALGGRGGERRAA